MPNIYLPTVGCRVQQVCRKPSPDPAYLVSYRLTCIDNMHSRMSESVMGGTTKNASIMCLDRQVLSVWPGGVEYQECRQPDLSRDSLARKTNCCLTLSL